MTQQLNELPIYRFHAADGERFFESDGPVLPAYKTPQRDTWKVWCDWCDRWHTHGAGEGHRCAHCACARSPFKDTGYNLVLVDEPAPRRRQARGSWCSPSGDCGNCPARRRSARDDRTP
jgi:hypothetical protein